MFDAPKTPADAYVRHGSLKVAAELDAFFFQPVLHCKRKREIHVVSAQQDVIAYRYSLESQVAVRL